MKKLLVILSLLMGSFISPVQANTCTKIANNTTDLVNNQKLVAGDVLCLHGGNYVHDILRFTGNGTNLTPITIMAYPNEIVKLISTGQASIELNGNYITFENIILDNSGIGIPAVVVRGNFITVSNVDISDGKNDGIDIRGTDTLVIGNKIHNFDTGVAGSDAHCIEVLQTSTRNTIDGNTIHDCSGDAIQFYYPNVALSGNIPANNTIIGNTFYRGNISYSENALDLKIGNGFNISNNDISGYGYEPTQLIAGGNPSIFIHKFSQNVNFHDNNIHDVTKGIRIQGNSGLDAGAIPMTITVQNNQLSNISGEYAFYTEGAQNVSYINNTLNNVTNIFETIPPQQINVINITPTKIPTLTATVTKTATPTPTATETPTNIPTMPPTATPNIYNCQVTILSIKPLVELVSCQ